MSKEKEKDKYPGFEHGMVRDELHWYVWMRNKQIEGLSDMGKNRDIIKEQNLAAKSGKYINKGEALRRMDKRLAEEKEKLMKGKK